MLFLYYTPRFWSLKIASDECLGKFHTNVLPTGNLPGPHHEEGGNGEVNFNLEFLWLTKLFG